MDYEKKWKLLKDICEEIKADCLEIFMEDRQETEAIDLFMAMVQVLGFMRIIEDNDFKNRDEVEEYLDKDRGEFWKKECAAVIAMIKHEEGVS